MSASSIPEDVSPVKVSQSFTQDLPNQSQMSPTSSSNQIFNQQTATSIFASKIKRKRDSLTGIEPVKLAPNPFNMTARNFPKQRHLLKNAFGFINRTKSQSSSPTNSLELVRSALQPSLNLEIEKVLHSYQEMFQMAAFNISDNLKEPITEEHISHILRRSLEEAKSLFKIHTDLEEGSSLKKEEGLMTSARSVIIKKSKPKREDREIRVKDNFNYPPWEESRLNEDVEVIMGVKANKILGFASARGRLYIRHPQLFKYLGDQDDKQWLYENGHMPITGGKAFLMLAEDICLLATNHPDYKDNLGIKAEDIKGFKVPEFLLKKMRQAMRRQALILQTTREADEA
ncbi:deoxynucleotidyltransferase terminal-interacting protein 1 isoform X3 [Hydra vulgaris]|uniref:Deoxynucleotidyltransferase terminal-interacting protein 1 isoform X3 n=2 Tax=Hydra vulgaris TaxID=6087 RepID=A0ABM4C5K8_HYDVU